MNEEQQQNKSTRSFEEWRLALQKLVERNDPTSRVQVTDEKVKPYYDQGLQPYVAFNELFNK